ncbi:MAG: YceI family protein [Chloroflexota bacterium]|nr:YceI family protein [Chloroflexota bacterium]
MRTFVITPDQSSASYIVDEEFLPDMLPKYGINIGRQDTVGVTPAVDGQIQLNLDDLAAALGDNRFHADLSLLESDQALRDQWIRENGPQFGVYPDAVFIANAIEGAPSSYTEGEEVSFRLLGDLTIREITQPATFEVSATLDGTTLSGSAVASLRMSDFDIEPPNFANTLTVQDEFTVRVDFIAQEQ